MDHTHLVQASDLDEYASRRDSQGVIPELVYLLIKQSVFELSVCRIPYGDAVNQPGLDGLVESNEFFLEFVPKGKSYWEIGTGGDPQSKATKDFKKRNDELSDEDKAESAFMFVTPRSNGSDGWNEPKQTSWLNRRKGKGWENIRIIDGVKLADWLREFPALGRWMAKKIGISSRLSGLETPAEHWELIQAQVHLPDPPLPPTIFISGRENACTALQALIEGKSQRLFLFAESPNDVEDFVSAYLASLEKETARNFGNRMLIIRDEDAWHSLSSTRKSHIFIADINLGLDSEKADLQTVATRNGHAVIVPICGAWSGGNQEIIKLRSPSKSTLEKILSEAGYPQMRARELASIGADRLSALRRHLLGLGTLPNYATWESARLLAQAGLIGKWDGKNIEDQTALDVLLGKEYGEWVETIRSETFRSDTPLIQKNEKWRIVARGEAWNSLGSYLTDNDLDQFQQTALQVLGERDPKFDLPKEERFSADLHGKQLNHSSNLRSGLAETLALIGSRPEVLSSCSQGKARVVTTLIIRGLFDDVDWSIWASLDQLLPLLAEGSPEEFLNSVESALADIDNSPFHQVYAQEGGGGLGEWNYMSGLLWALETLAWHSNYFTRVILLLGDLASIDPGGNWSNRPSNSLADILLPWHPQTCVPITKRKTAVATLLREQPQVGWELLIALLPHSHGFTSGCHRPAWRNLITPDWKDGVTHGEHWEQISIYTEMAIDVAKSDVDKLCVLIESLPDLPQPAFDNLLLHFKSKDIFELPELNRMPLWESLNDLTRKHRGFSDTNWAMPEDLIERIESISNTLTPSSPEYKYHYLFSGRDHDLYSEKGDYEEQRKQLTRSRQAALQEIIDEKGVDTVLSFAKNVSAPRLVGEALGVIALDSIELQLLPNLLETEDEVKRSLISSYIWSRFNKLKWIWADKLLANEWSVAQRSAFLVFLPFGKNTWLRVKKYLSSNEFVYWKNVIVNPWCDEDDITEAIENLIKYGRASAAILCLGSAGNKNAFQPELATRALLAVINQEHPERDFDANSTIEVITKLQNSPIPDTDALFKIEWNFLPLLGRFSQGSPKTLENRLASDPAFFCEVVALVFRSKNETNKDETPTEHQRDLAQNAYKLLSEWKTPPGTDIDGSFNEDSFNIWLKETKQIATATGHIDIALSQLGQVLTRAPKDKDNLWINETVAQALDGKDAKTMRSGFTTELFNQRGVHSPTAGIEERKLAKINRERSESLEEKGYSRFATAMREFAERYEREAEYEASRDPYE